MIKSKIVCAIAILILLISLSLVAQEISQNVEIKEPGQNKESLWWLSDLISLFGILIGTMFIFYQVRKQHKNSMDLQAEDYRNRYRLEIYKEFSGLINKAKNESTELSSEIMLFTDNFLDKIRYSLMGGSVERADLDNVFKLNDSYIGLQKNYTEIVFLIEKYEIVVPEFKIYKDAFNSIAYRTGKNIKKLKDLLITLVPFDEDRLRKVEQALSNYHLMVLDEVGYLYDLEIDLQNKLLNKLFKNELVKRTPRDPSVVVVTTDVEQKDKLKKYFENIINESLGST